MDDRFYFYAQNTKIITLMLIFNPLFIVTNDYSSKQEEIRNATWVPSIQDNLEYIFNKASEAAANGLGILINNSSKDNEQTAVQKDGVEQKNDKQTVVPSIVARKYISENNYGKVALVTSGTIVSALIIYKIYQYWKKRCNSKDKKLDVILKKFHPIKIKKALNDIVSILGKDVAKDLTTLSLVQVNAVIESLHSVTSTDDKRLMIAVLLKKFKIEKEHKTLLFATL